MFDFDAMRVELETLYRDIAIDAGVPIDFDNIPVSRELQSARDKEEKWVRLNLQDSVAIQRSIGPNAAHNFVVIGMLQIFVPIKSGTAKARKLATLFANRIKKAEIDYCEIRTPSITSQSEDGNWFVMILSTQFLFDQYE